MLTDKNKIALIGKMKLLIAFLLVFTGLLYATASERSVTLTWDPNTESDLAGYILNSGLASGVYTETLQIDKNLTSTSMLLPVGFTYFFALQAFDASDNISEMSTEVNIALQTDPDPKWDTKTLIDSLDLVVQDDAGVYLVDSLLVLTCRNSEFKASEADSIFIRYREVGTVWQYETMLISDPLVLLRLEPDPAIYDIGIALWKDGKRSIYSDSIQIKHKVLVNFLNFPLIIKLKV